MLVGSCCVSAGRNSFVSISGFVVSPVLIGISSVSAGEPTGLVISLIFSASLSISSASGAIIPGMFIPKASAVPLNCGVFITSGFSFK